MDQEVVCASAGAALAIGVLAVGAGIATGGIGFAVVGGLGSYFGVAGGILCSL